MRRHLITLLAALAAVPFSASAQSGEEDAPPAQYSLAGDLFFHMALTPLSPSTLDEFGHCLAYWQTWHERLTDSPETLTLPDLAEPMMPGWTGDQLALQQERFDSAVPEGGQEDAETNVWIEAFLANMSVDLIETGDEHELAAYAATLGLCQIGPTSQQEPPPG